MHQIQTRCWHIGYRGRASYCRISYIRCTIPVTPNLGWRRGEKYRFTDKYRCKYVFADVFLSSELFCRVAAKEKFFKPNLQLFKVSHSLSEVHYRPGHLAQNLTFSMDGLKGTSMDFAEEEPETEVTECFREKLTPYVLLFFHTLESLLQSSCNW